MNFYKYLFGVYSGESIAMDEGHEGPANGETLAEHREHCDAKPGNCPFEKRAKAILESEDRTDRHGGRYKGKGDESEGVRSYVTKAENEGTASSPKWVEVKSKNGKATKDDHSEWMKKKKSAKWYELPKVGDDSDTPNLDSFSEVPALDVLTISQIDKSKMYARSDKPTEGGATRYSWTKNGQKVSDEESSRLEKALAEAGFTQALFDGNTNVLVRPDLYNGDGQSTSFTNREGKNGNDYFDKHVIREAIAKYKNVLKILPHYGKIKDRIFDGCDRGDERAILAYAMMRTKIRVGSENSPKKGRGLRNLRMKDVKVSDDNETVYLSFNGKSSQWWHVTLKDRFLYEFFKKKREGMSSPSDTYFNVPYEGDNGITKYLKDISEDLVGSREEALTPHDFRRLGATRIAATYMEKELGNGLDPTKDRKKLEDRVVKAVIEAARHLNDKPSTVYKSYVVPSLLFASNKEEMLKRFPYLKGELD